VAEFTEIILHAGLSSNPLGELYGSLPDPVAKVKLLMPSTLALPYAHQI